MRKRSLRGFRPPSMPVSALATAVVLTLAACGAGTEQTPTPMLEPELASLVSVTGEVVPAQWAVLSIQTSGVVADVLVEPGDEVKAGDLVVQLDTVDAELAVHEAEAQLASARAQVEQLEAQPRPVDVAVAEEQLDEAEAGVSQAAAERDQLTSGALASDVADAEAQLESAEAEREAARIAYDQVKDQLENSGVEDWEAEEAALRLRAAEENLEAAELALTYARSGAAARLAEVEAGVRGAEAQADVARAQLEQAMTGVRSEEIALAQAGVTEAEIVLKEAELWVERCESRAPFDGTVGRVDVREGEQVQQGDRILTLGDLSELRVETTDLDEIDVANVAVGQSVEVTFDAFPDRVFMGRVIRINPMAEAGSGGVNYTTIIQLQELGPEIRWGMTAFVDIDVAR